MKRHLFPAVVALLTFACFAVAIGNDWVNFDDTDFITLRHEWRGFSPTHLGWMFTNLEGHYIPLTWMSFALDHAVWGMDATGYHLTNVLLHVLCAVLAYFVLLRLLKSAGDGARWGAMFGALFFSLHPLRAESVAWVTERRDVLSGAFFLLALLAYFRAHDGPRTHLWLAISVGCHAAGLLSKAMALLLPLVLIVIDIVPLGRWPGTPARRLLLEKVPFLAVSLGAVLVTKAAQSSLGALLAVPLDLQLMQPAYRICFYLWKTLSPFDLSPQYLMRPEEGVTAAHGGALVLVGLLAALLWFARRKIPALPAAAVAFVLLLAPVLGIPQSGPIIGADRYSYLPSLALAALVGLGIAAAFGRARLWPAAPVLLGVVLALFGFASWQQSRVWKDSVTLWTRAIANDPRQHMAYFNRGTALWEQGARAAALKDYSESLRLLPGQARVLVNRAAVLMSLGDGPGAMADLTHAIESDPRSANARALRGQLRQAAGDSAGALQDFDRAIELDGRNPDMFADRSALRAASGDRAGARADLEQALRIAPPGWPSRSDALRRLEALMR
jgi:tetratricopeptide (TPR) repeat protein